jgi:chromosome segregation ATPase
MSKEETPFKIVMRGYEPAEVDRVMTDMSYPLGQAELQTAELARRLDQAAQDAAHRPAPVAEPAKQLTFEDLGTRIAQILTLAEDEAAEIRSSAASEIDRKLAEIEASNSSTRADAERYAAETRMSIEREAARIVEEAKRSADQLLDDADRQSTARREEAEAFYEQQRAQAGQAAADFERTLADRREKAEADFQHRTQLATEQLNAAQQHAASLRAEIEQSSAELARKSARTIAEAEQKAAQVVAEAMTRADRIRAESERELAAATQRRDSINSQLTNVRQMLATLSGTTPGQFDNGAAPAQQLETEEHQLA